MRDDAIAIRNKEQKLIVPIVGGKRPTMMEHDGLRVPRTPILVVNLNAVLARDEGTSPVELAVRRLACRLLRLGRTGQDGGGRHEGKSAGQSTAIELESRGERL